MLPPSVRVEFLPMSTVAWPANFTGTGTGIANIYFTPTNAPLIGAAYIIVSSYYVICLVLNILLTLMIIAKLILHRRNLRHAIGTSNGATGVYTTIVTILLESYTLYAIALLSYIITWAMQSAGVYVTARILGNVQVCTVFHFPHVQAQNDIPPHRSLLHISSFYELPSGKH